MGKSDTVGMAICATSLLQTTGNESTENNYKSDRPYYIGEHLGHGITSFFFFF
jgi:hypothetical protein